MKQKLLVALIFPIWFVFINFGIGPAEQKQDMGGWEKGSKYDKLFDPAEVDSFKGWVIQLKTIVPLPGMSPGVALMVSETRDLKSEPILVHLCPTWFADSKSIGLKKGDRVKVKGVWAEISDQDVFIASKIKKGNYFEFKARLSKDGTPFWTMSPEELATERTASQAALKKTK